jgi:hypothetical protein
MKGVVGMIDKKELDQLDKSWTIIMIIWVALFSSLSVYLLIGKIIEGGLKPVADLPFDSLRIVLYGAAGFVFFIAHFIRKALLKIPERSSVSTIAQTSVVQGQHPAAGKYLTAIIAAAALSESIGIFGLVYFALSKDSTILYLFIAFSAIAMIVYRPRKDELLRIVLEMQKRGRDC